MNLTDEQKERVKALRASLEELDAELDRVKQMRHERNRELSILVPPPPVRVSVNKPHQLAMNERIKADTRQRLIDAGKLDEAGMK